MIHEAEEDIANAIKENRPIDYVALKNRILLKTIKLEHDYPVDFFAPDKAETYYRDKIYGYLEKGIYRLENYMKEHPELEIVGAEIPFKFDLYDYHFSGKIDRVLRNKNTGEYICHDVKTYSELKEQKDLATPLQFVVYTHALKEMYGVLTEQVSCGFDLPFCNTIQAAGTNGYMNRGMEKIKKELEKINNKEFEPHPTPLCAWCIYSPTNPNQPRDPNAHNRCPYHSLWTKDNKNQINASEWLGMENHKIVLEKYIEKQKH
jgi:hypothetical protein